MSQDPQDPSGPHEEHDADANRSSADEGNEPTQRLPENTEGPGEPASHSGGANAEPQPGAEPAPHFGQGVYAEQPARPEQPGHPEQPRHPEETAQADPAGQTPGWGDQPADPESHAGHPAPGPKRPRRGIGCGLFAVGVVLAGLLGGGVVVGGQAIFGEPTAEVGDSGPGIEINDPEDASQITAAADQASASVVTLAVGGQGGSGSGSGIILDDEGHVLTNTHVVTLGGSEAQPEIQVQLNDGRVTTAEIVGTDPLSDLAVIQLQDTENLTPAEIGSSTDLNVGDQTIAIGAPLSLAGTVTTGIVSTLDRTIQVASSAVEPEAIEPDTDMFDQFESEDQEQSPDDEGGFEFFFPDQEETPSQGSVYLNVIQTDAAINQGNSGGALVDSEGRVIGVNVAIASTGGGGMQGGGGAGSIGVGFSIPIDYAERIASDLIEDAEASHGLLGVQVLPAHPDAEANQEMLGASEGDPLPPMGFSAGGLVTAVSEQSPASEAGIQEGDVIEAVEGRQIQDGTALTATVREYASGETITLTILRDGERQDIDVTLESM